MIAAAPRAYFGAVIDVQRLPLDEARSTAEAGAETQNGATTMGRAVSAVRARQRI